ncbi:MAG: nucleotide exchange factor GrpE [Spirochaetaceae bacterium]|jgi:molecular chaperone GrpE|nr:nucleotide exchange factor GrpE [Spirochaetaceae bacterium]
MKANPDQNEDEALNESPAQAEGSPPSGAAVSSENTQDSDTENAENSIDGQVDPCPEQKIADLEAKNAELNDLYLRKAADFENFRKRNLKEKQDAIDFANQSLLLDLIPILDDFERAIKVAESSAKTEADFNAFCEGISMVEKRLLADLENKWALKRYDSSGTLFDPAKHEALMMEKSDDVAEATVQEDFAKGYMLKDRVIRAAKVKVLMPEG